MFALFGLTTLCQIFQTNRHRKAFCMAITTGGLWETLSFAARVISALRYNSERHIRRVFSACALRTAFHQCFRLHAARSFDAIFLAWEYLVWNLWVKTGCYFHQFRCHVSRPPPSHPFHSLANGQPDLSLFKLAVVFCPSAKMQKQQSSAYTSSLVVSSSKNASYILHGFDTAIQQQLSVLKKQ